MPILAIENLSAILRSADLLRMREQIAAKRAHGEPTVPSLLGEERKCNPFLRPGAEGLLVLRSPGQGQLCEAVRCAQLHPAMCHDAFLILLPARSLVQVLLLNMLR